MNQPEITAVAEARAVLWEKVAGYPWPPTENSALWASGVFQAYETAIRAERERPPTGSCDDCGHTYAWHNARGCRAHIADPAGRRDCHCSGWRESPTQADVLAKAVHKEHDDMHSYGEWTEVPL